jgi:hypothetical protein
MNRKNGFLIEEKISDVPDLYWPKHVRLSPACTLK